MVCFKFHLIYLHKPFTVNKQRGRVIFLPFAWRKFKFPKHKISEGDYLSKEIKETEEVYSDSTELTDVFITAIDLTRDMILDSFIGE